MWVLTDASSTFPNARRHTGHTGASSLGVFLGRLESVLSSTHLVCLDDVVEVLSLYSSAFLFVFFEAFS